MFIYRAPKLRLASDGAGIGPGRADKAACALDRVATLPSGDFAWTRDGGAERLTAEIW